MQKYRPKAPLANAADHVLRLLLPLAMGLMWFVYLWGLSLPALAAGAAFGGLLWLLARLFGKKSVEKREKQMRRMIGGELAVRRLLLQSPRRAAFQAALWVAPACPLCMRRAVDWGVLGTLNGRETLLRLISQHESQPVQARQLVEAAREAGEHGAALVVCLTAPASREALAWAGEAEPPIRVISREELISLAGLCCPATDEDLRALGQRRRKRKGARAWLKHVTEESRSRRYFWYGMGLSALALLTGQRYYPLPAAMCLGLFAACKWRAWREKR